MDAVGRVVCTRCGSLQTRVIGGSIPARVVALLLRQHVIVCARCGFHGRQPRAAAASRPDRAVRASSRQADARIDLAALDRALEHDATKKPSHTKGI